MIHIPRPRLRRRTSGPDAAWLRRVLATGAFYIRYEPIISLADGSVIGHEALTRFVDGTPPADAFAAAIAAGMSRELELATLEAAVVAAYRLPPDGYLSLNATPALIIEAPNDILERLRRTRRSIVIELLEEPRVIDWPRLRDSLKLLRQAAGVQVAVDDLGGAFAGLMYLLELRPSIIKLERSVARDVESDGARQALLRALNEYAREAGAVLVVEGVETQAQESALINLGLPYAQGYLYPAS